MGCGKDSVDKVPGEFITDSSHDSDLFKLFHFRDITGFDKESLRVARSTDSETWITGIKNKKVWIGKFDVEKKQTDEWIGKEDLSVSVKAIGLASLMKTDWGYVCLAGLFSSTEYQLNDNIGESVFFLQENSVYRWDTGVVVKSGDDESKLTVCGNYVACKRKRDDFHVFLSNKGGVLKLQVSDEFVKGDSLYVADIVTDKLHIQLFYQWDVLKEWNGEKVLNRSVKYHVGYNKFVEYDIDTVIIADLEVKKWGAICSPQYMTKDGQCCNDDIILLDDQKKLASSFPNVRYERDWYDKSVLVSQQKEITYSDEDKLMVISSIGESLVEFPKKYNEDSYMETCIYSSPTSYTSVLKIKRASDWADYTVIWVELLDLVEKKILWSVNVMENISTSAQIDVTELSKNVNEWSFQIQTTTNNGTQKDIRFSVDLKTGKLKYNEEKESPWRTH